MVDPHSQYRYMNWQVASEVIVRNGDYNTCVKWRRLSLKSSIILIWDLLFFAYTDVCAHMYIGVLGFWSNVFTAAAYEKRLWRMRLINWVRILESERRVGASRKKKVFFTTFVSLLLIISSHTHNLERAFELDTHTCWHDAGREYSCCYFFMYIFCWSRWRWKSFFSSFFKCSFCL